MACNGKVQVGRQACRVYVRNAEHTEQHLLFSCKQEGEGHGTQSWAHASDGSPVEVPNFLLNVRPSNIGGRCLVPYWMGIPKEVPGLPLNWGDAKRGAWFPIKDETRGSNHVSTLQAGRSLLYICYLVGLEKDRNQGLFENILLIVQFSRNILKGLKFMEK